jgi:hypothetical protein
VNPQFLDGKEWVCIFELSDGVSEALKICLRQIDDPKVATPICEFFFLERAVRFKAGRSLVDLMAGQKRSHPRRKPSDRRAVRAKRTQAIVANSRGVSGLLQFCRLGYHGFGCRDFGLQIVDLCLNRIAAFIERSQKERKVEVEQRDQAKSSQKQFFDLLFIHVRTPPFSGEIFAQWAPASALWGTAPSQL